MPGWLITGANRGLGRALALAAADAGRPVVGTARRAADAAALEAERPGLISTVLCDMADPAAVRAAVETAEHRLGGLDVLVNNAGYGVVGSIEETSLEAARAQFDVNFFGPLVAIQTALPYLRARRAGRILNISSISGLAGWAGTGVYCASKHALEGLGKTLDQETRAFGVRVINAEPGGMRTDYAGSSLQAAPSAIEAYAGTAHQALAILSGHHGQEHGDPVRIATALLRLVDDPDPPVQILLGEDAVKYAFQAAGAFQEAFARWASLSLSTGFTSPPD